MGHTAVCPKIFCPMFFVIPAPKGAGITGPFSAEGTQIGKNFFSELKFGG